MSKTQQDGIPKEDMEAINQTFAKDQKALSLKKDARGKAISEVAKDNAKQKGFTIVCGTGRILKHNKSVIPVGGKQILIGTKGQLFDDISEEKRKLIMWSESDFV